MDAPTIITSKGIFFVKPYTDPETIHLSKDSGISLFDEDERLVIKLSGARFDPNDEVSVIQLTEEIDNNDEI
jgi:hypothetical protein